MKYPVRILTLAVALLCASNLWAKTIVFATDPTWPPMEFLEANGEISGFTIDYIRAVAKEAGFQAEFTNVDWDYIFSGLEQGKYQAICSSVSITPDRERLMDFSQPYFKVSQALVTRVENPARSLEGMAGRTIGVLVASTGQVAVKMTLGLKDKAYDRVEKAFEDLDQNLIDGVICDDPVAAQFALHTPRYQGRFKLASRIKTSEEEYYGVAVAKGDKQDLDLINLGIQAVKAKGMDKELIHKWINH